MAHIPTFKQLRYLCAIADTMHFGQAAKQCHVSQSTLSAAINELEQLLEVNIVERNNKKVLLTTVGEEVVKKSRKILTEVDDLVSFCSTSDDFFNGKLRMGVIPTIAPFLLPSFMRKVRQEYPNLKLFIREDLSNNLINSLQHGDLDLLLLALPYQADNVETEELFYDEFFLACHQDNGLCNERELHTKDLKGKPVLLLEDGHCLRDHALDACRIKPNDIDIPYQATSLNTIVQMVANGVGVTLLPKIALHSNILHGTDVTTHRFVEQDVGRSIGLMWRKTSPFSDDFKKLGELVKLSLAQAEAKIDSNAGQSATNA